MSLINSKLITPNDVIIESIENNDDTDILNESFAADLGKSFLKGAAVGVGILTITNLFSLLHYNIKYNSSKKKMTTLSDYKKLVSKVNDILDKVKFIKYKEGVPEVISSILSKTNEVYKKLVSLDADLQNIKTYDELKEKEQSFKDSYKNLRDEYTTFLYEEYKNISDNWIVGNTAIIKQLKSFTTIDYNAYNRYNLNDGELKNSFSILRTDEEHGKEIESILYNILGVFGEVPTSFKEVKNILSCIKVQLKGDEIKDKDDKKVIKESTEDISVIEESLNDIERDIKIDELNEFDDLTESIVTIDSLLESVSIIMNNEVSKLHAMQYDILSECVDSDRVDKMNALYESAIGDMFNKLITLISAAIEKVKSKLSTMTTSAIAGFDIYGKWAETFEKKIKNIPSQQVSVEMHNWDTSSLFNDSQFSDICNFASVILGKATTKDDMKKKLNDFYNKSWSNNDIYNFIMKKYYPRASFTDETKSTIIKNIEDSIMNTSSNVLIDDNKIKSYIKLLKEIKNHVTKFATNSKITMLNPEFNTLIKDCKKASKTVSEDSDPVEFRYYRERYNVLSVVQQAMLDIYYIRVKLIKTYAKDLQKACKLYASSVNTESVDYLSMKHESIKGAAVLTEA